MYLLSFIDLRKYPGENYIAAKKIWVEIKKHNLALFGSSFPPLTYSLFFNPKTHFIHSPPDSPITLSQFNSIHFQTLFTTHQFSTLSLSILKLNPLFAISWRTLIKRNHFVLRSIHCWVPRYSSFSSSSWFLLLH